MALSGDSALPPNQPLCNCIAEGDWTSTSLPPSSLPPPLTCSTPDSGHPPVPTSFNGPRHLSSPNRTSESSTWTTRYNNSQASPHRQALRVWGGVGIEDCTAWQRGHRLSLPLDEGAPSRSLAALTVTVMGESRGTQPKSSVSSQRGVKVPSRVMVDLLSPLTPDPTVTTASAGSNHTGRKGGDWSSGRPRRVLHSLCFSVDSCPKPQHPIISLTRVGFANQVGASREAVGGNDVDLEVRLVGLIT